MLFCAPAAHAGTWLLTYSAAGTENTAPFDPAPVNTFSDAATGTNTVSNGQSWTRGYDVPGGTSVSMTINVTVTGKWTHGTGQDDTNDPAPPSVMVIETVYLDQDGVNGDGTLATGAFDDAFGDQSYVVSSYRGLDQVCTTPSGIPIQHQSIEPGSPFTIARTFKVSSTAAAYQQNGCNAAAHFEGYTATIHAQPYNWHQTTGVDNGDGTLSFTYGWLSTSGDIKDLTTCFEHERVVYPSSSDPYIPPPPFDQSVGYHNPSVAPGTGSNGIEMNETDTNLDTHHVFGTISPFSPVTVTAAQRYEFDDTATGRTNIIIPGPDSQPSITRQVYSVGAPPIWYYSVTKNSLTATKSL